MVMKPIIRIKRVYETPQKSDGVRILADRLWPRGINKQDAAIDEWAKNLAPSAGLRTWYGHQPELWAAFQQRYLSELSDNGSVEAFIKKYSALDTITLVYAAKDTAHTHALVLQHYLEQMFE